MVETFVSCLGNAHVVPTDVALDDKYRIDILDTYNNVEMCFDEHNFYMPSGSLLNAKSIYMASIATHELDWIESWIKDCTEDEVIEMFKPMVILNTTDDDKHVTWYNNRDSGIIYMEYGNNICAAKQLSFNQWYIYTSSLYYKDYVLQGVNTIHRAE